MNLRRIVRDRLAERRTFRGVGGWLLSLYDRLLNRVKTFPLPGRRRACRVAVRGLDAPVALRLGTTDWLVLNELVARDEYRDVFAADLGPVESVIDLGANIGLSVRLWRARYPQAHVVAVEPDAGNVAALRENVRLAGQEAWVKIVPACAMGHVRPVQMVASAQGEWALAARDVAQSDLKVVTMTDLLAELPAGRSVDLLKCDIEGAEAELFENCGGWLGRVRHAVVELHAPYVLASLEAALQKNRIGYRIRHHHAAGGLALVIFSTAGASPP